MRRICLGLLFLFCTVIFSSGQTGGIPRDIPKEKLQSLTQPQLIPGQKIALKDPESTLHPAAKPCENYKWGAVMEALVSSATKDIQFTQKELAFKVASGDLCLPALTDYEQLNRFVTGDHPLLNSRHVRITATYTPGMPPLLDSVIFSLRSNQPMMVIWNGHPYMLTGLVYDEYVYATGDRQFIVREMQLLDPGRPVNHPDRQVKFINGRDDASGITGVIAVKAESY